MKFDVPSLHIDNTHIFVKGLIYHLKDHQNYNVGKVNMNLN
jgi:hypothetical protein